MPYVHVTLARGRSSEQKHRLMAAVASAIHEAIDAPLETVRVWITDVDPSEMSIGGVPLDEVRGRQAKEING